MLVSKDIHLSCCLAGFAGLAGFAAQAAAVPGHNAAAVAADPAAVAPFPGTTVTSINPKYGGGSRRHFP